MYPAYYYDFGPSFSISLPITVHLYLNSSVTDLNGYGYPTVEFGYNIVNAGTGASEASGVYDTVLFNSTMAAASTRSPRISSMGLSSPRRATSRGTPRL